MTAPRLPAARRPEVTLHVGMGKTGTTTIQSWLHHHRQGLLDLGVLFPESPGERRHWRLGMAMEPERRPGLDWQRSGTAGPEELRPLVERDLVAEVDVARPSRLVLSDEALLAPPDGTIGHLRDLFDRIASSVRVVAYLRRQDDHLRSRYQQVVKQGTSVRRLSERAQQMQGARLYDYPARLADWESALRPDELVVRRFQPSSFPDNSLLRDFVGAAGLDVSLADFPEPPVRNESLDAECVELLRLLNLLQRERAEPIAGMPRRPQLVRRLRRASGGPSLTLPDEQLDHFMARWEEPNRVTARRFFPDGPKELFEPRRTSRRTTTVQHLEPERIAHFVDALTLPAQLLVPLQQIAEREASSEQRPGAGDGPSAR